MRDFFKKLRVLWIISRIFLILCLVTLFIGEDYLNRLTPKSQVVGSILILTLYIYVISNIWILITELRKSANVFRIVTIFNGAISLILGLTISVLLFTQGMDQFVLVMQIVPLWFIAFGLNDIIST